MHIARVWVESGVRNVGELIGLVTPSDQEESGSPAKEDHTAGTEKPIVVDDGKRTGGGLSSLFGGLGFKSSSSATRSSNGIRGPPPPGTYKLAEVRADYVKVGLSFFSQLTHSNTDCHSFS